ncbi:MAG TPA: phosphatase PAP2 family protein [Bacteroidetes bacterium]|nr:phosphatase PAP2 family protein [Bacteroidota bacterium]
MAIHLPLLHISSRPVDPPHDEDPLRLGRVEGRDLIPWLADAQKAIERAAKRNPLLDAAALALAAVGSEITYFALMGGLFSAYDRKTALSLAGVILPSVTLNQIVKARFHFRRPPREAMHPWAFVAPGDFTFPSGHAQNAAALGAFLVLKAKKPWVRGTGVAIALAIPLSRLYLGVHYPRDVLVGSLLGVGSVAAVNLLEEPFKRWWESSPRGARGFTVGLSTGIAGVLTGTPLAAFPLGLAGGLAIGQDVSGRMRFSLDKPGRVRRIVNGALGVGVFIGTGFAIRPLMKRESSITASLAGGLVGVALTLGVPMAAGLLKRAALLRERRRKRAVKSAARRAGRENGPASRKGGQVTRKGGPAGRHPRKGEAA